MITQIYRPKSFAEVRFQDLPKKVLKAIARDPADKPQTLILSGSYGSGKTTLARIFARALNCHSLTQDVCLKCGPCIANMETSNFYTEYDSSVIGNVNSLRSLIDTFSFSVHKGHRVILFDEAQVISREAQSALLKITEESPKKVFFLFATTDPQNLLPALRSRSLELEFSIAPADEIRLRLLDVTTKLGISLPEEVQENIVYRSKGHFRTVDMLLDLYQILGDDFISSYKSNDSLFDQFLVASFEGKSRDILQVYMDAFHTIPLAQLKSDFEHYLVKLAECATSRESKLLLASKLGVGSFNLIKYHLSPWGQAAFISDPNVDMYFWSLRALLAQMSNKSVPGK